MKKLPEISVKDTEVLVFWDRETVWNYDGLAENIRNRQWDGIHKFTLTELRTKL